MVSTFGNSQFSGETMTKRRTLWPMVRIRVKVKSALVNFEGGDEFSLKGSLADLMEETLPKDCAEIQ